MEPFFPALLAGGTLAFLLARRADKRFQWKSRSVATLPSLVTAHSVGDPNARDASQVVVIAVHTQRAKLAPHLAGKRLRMRVKYGLSSESLSCDLAAAAAASRLPPQERGVIADFNSVALFLGHPDIQSVIRLRLRGGKLEHNIAKAEMHLQPRLGAEEKDMELLGNKGELVGHVHVRIEVCTITVGELQQCLRLVDAKAQKEAFVAGGLPIEEGILVEDLGNEPVAQDPVLQGRPVIVSSELGSFWRRVLATGGLRRASTSTW